ncbi:hypothetical protein IF1G_06441 [Cordyceps javanica]|uniref:Uncharacterized protein n=1 Tax=Cordyceps javanica TaxID=43265 RepID=A0A545V164_9HYPO|nr:hypothetical protein IF1G_06441 [Cordyceps javanica]
MDQADSISNRDAAADPVPQHVANSDTEQLGLPTAHLKAMNGWSLWLTLAWYAPTNRQRDAKFVSGGDAEWPDCVGPQGWKDTNGMFVNSIVFRAFQGLGGAGLYSLAMTVMTEVTPVQYIGVAVGLMGGIFATSSILGTMLGGIIASAAACLPPGVICLLIVIFIFPVNPEPLPLTWHTLEGIDFLGVATLLGGCIPLIFALESGGIHYRWNSSVVVVTLVVGGVSLFGFITWQWYIYKRQANRYILPLFPARIVSQRTSGLIIL